ncbi:hypothetical protein ACFLU4_07650 [Chloroflexota bacterium]
MSASSSTLVEATDLTILAITEGDVFIMKSGTDTWTETDIGTTLENGDRIKAVVVATKVVAVVTKVAAVVAMQVVAATTNELA